MRNILKTSKKIPTAFSETYTRVRRLMQLMQTYATYANICKLMQTPEILQKSYLQPSSRFMHVCADICNLCKILKSSKIIYTAFPEIYALVRRHMPIMQTYANS